MSLDLSAERRELLSVSGDLLDALAPLGLARAFLEGRGDAGALWAAVADGGWYAAGLDDDDPFGVVGLCLLAWQCGAHAAPTPLVDTAVAARLAAHGPGAPRLAQGTATAALAVLERGLDWHLGEPATALDGNRLNGVKLGVRHAGAVEALAVVAEAEDGLAVAFVAPGAPGVTVAPVAGFDPAAAPCIVTFDDAPVPAGAVLRESAGARAALGHAFAVGQVAAAAEGLGAASRALDMAIAHARERTQFSRPIGTFQALQHVMAAAHVDREVAWATVLAAARAIDDGAEDALAFASLAKALAARSSRAVVEAALQVHGGIAFTWEHDVHLLQRRVLECERHLGDALHHERIQGDLIALRAR